MTQEKIESGSVPNKKPDPTKIPGYSSGHNTLIATVCIPVDTVMMNDEVEMRARQGVKLNKKLSNNIAPEKKSR